MMGKPPGRKKATRPGGFFMVMQAEGRRLTTQTQM
jgi:hypothetical protein